VVSWTETQTTTPAFSPPLSERNAIAGPSKSTESKYAGQLLYPPPEPPVDDPHANMAVLGLVEKREPSIARDLEEEDRACEVAVNGRFGLVAIGTKG
jgi:hypothetical protein